MRSIAAKGRLVAHTPQAQARSRVLRDVAMLVLRPHGNSQINQCGSPNRVYLRAIQPRLTKITASRLSAALKVSKPYAARFARDGAGRIRDTGERLQTWSAWGQTQPTSLC